MVHAIVAVEDKRFWSDPGVDLKGLLRAAVSDVSGGPHEGASTIAEQFVKNALAEQDNRTMFEKLREAALAFQLVHKWKRTKILTEYLNTIYFGYGAYGIESAARVYFGSAHGYSADAGPDGRADGCGDPTPQAPQRPQCAECSPTGRRRCSQGWSRTPRRSIPSRTRRPQAGGATSCSPTCSSRATSRRRSTSTGSAGRCRRRRRSSSRRSHRPRPTSRAGCVPRSSRRSKTRAFRRSSPRTRSTTAA